MASAKIPDPLERRHLVGRDLKAAQALKIAEAYLAEERTVDAIDFLRKAENEDGLFRLRREAVKNGDGFLLRAVVAAMGSRAQPDEWEALATAAAAAGKERYAADARRQAEREED